MNVTSIGQWCNERLVAGRSEIKITAKSNVGIDGVFSHWIKAIFCGFVPNKPAMIVKWREAFWSSKGYEMQDCDEIVYVGDIVSIATVA